MIAVERSTKSRIGLVLGDEGAGVLDDTDPRARQEPYEPLPVLEREEPVVARPHDRRRLVELRQAFGDLAGVARAAGAHGGARSLGGPPG